MEKILDRVYSLKSILLMVAIGGVLLLILVSITYGLDAIAPGVHDLFHDFRHAIGFPCH